MQNVSFIDCIKSITCFLFIYLFILLSSPTWVGVWVRAVHGLGSFQHPALLMSRTHWLHAAKSNYISSDKSFFFSLHQYKYDCCKSNHSIRLIAFSFLCFHLFGCLPGAGNCPWIFAKLKSYSKAAWLTCKTSLFYIINFLFACLKPLSLFLFILTILFYYVLSSLLFLFSPLFLSSINP